MAWEVEFTDEFGRWWDSLTEAAQIDVNASVMLLQQFGPTLRFPHSSGIAGARFSEMRELRIQHRGRPYRVLYAFDPRRVALLLIGGDKTGHDRWYEEFVPIADRIFAQHLKKVRQKKQHKGQVKEP